MERKRRRRPEERKRKRRPEESETRKRIRQKKKARFKRRCLDFVKLCVMLVVLAGVGWCLREAYGYGRGIFDHYYAIYQDYEARRQEQRKEIDERFDGYTNVLVLGLDEGTLVPDERAVAAHQAWSEQKQATLAAQAAWEKEQAVLREERAKERAAREAERQKLLEQREREIAEIAAAKERGELTEEEAKARQPEPVPELAPEAPEEPSPDFSVPAEPAIPNVRIGQHADTVMIYSLNNATGELRVISVPRGSLVDVPELKAKGVKLNTVFAEGGSTLMVKTLSRELGISLHHYVELDTELLAELIDSLGGIDIYVETDMYYEDPESGLKINIPQGFRHMDGDTVQKYLRYRSGELGDVGRLQRQQRFVRSAFAALLKPGNVTKLPQLTELLQRKLDTSAEIWDSVQLLKALQRIKGEPQTIMLQGMAVKGDESAWLPDKKAVQEKMQELFPELNSK